MAATEAGEARVEEKKKERRRGRIIQTEDDGAALSLILGTSRCDGKGQRARSGGQKDIRISHSEYQAHALPKRRADCARALAKQKAVMPKRLRDSLSGRCSL